MEAYPTVAERAFNVGLDLELHGADEAVKDRYLGVGLV